jgi:hypothetical protein
MRQCRRSFILVDGVGADQPRDGSGSDSSRARNPTDGVFASGFITTNDDPPIVALRAVFPRR